MSADRQKLQAALVRTLNVEATVAEMQATRLAEDLNTSGAMEQLHRASAIRKLAYEIRQKSDEGFNSWLD